MSGLRDYKPRHVFTPEDDAALLRLIAEGRTYREIGRELNRNPGSVGVRLARLRAIASGVVKAKPCHPPRPKPIAQGVSMPAVQQRPCLCCRRPFFSQGPHNRLCMTCRGKSISPFAIA